MIALLSALLLMLEIVKAVELCSMQDSTWFLVMKSQTRYENTVFNQKNGNKSNKVQNYKNEIFEWKKGLTSTML